MYTRNSIKRLVAILLLLLFTLRSAPASWLHESLTGHRHQSGSRTGEHKWQTSRGSFQCNWNDDAFQSGFLAATSIIASSPVVALVTYNTPDIPSRLPSTAWHYSLRGPPASC